MHPYLSLLLFVFLVSSCSKKILPEYDAEKIPAPPDYASPNAWAAHPAKPDPADLVPGKNFFTQPNPNPDVDVFFVHPTIYSKKHNPEWPWQGDTYNRKLNNRVDNSTIKYQASVFNGSAKVYAPRYRQAHIKVFSISDTALKDRALQFAYEDVKAAFEYYLEHDNKGRPFILASHSQGTVHAARLVKDYIEGKPLANQLVAAYLVGIGLKKDLFEKITPCNAPSETGCWISWNTYERHYYPPRHQEYFAPALSTNPLTWTTDTTYAPPTLNEASVLRNFNKVLVNLCDAQNHEGLLWITKPKFPGSAFYKSKRYHIADYNLFYGNIRSNVKVRIAAYKDQQHQQHNTSKD